MSKFIIPVLDEFGNKIYFETSPHKGQESVDGYQSVVLWLEKNGFKMVLPTTPSQQQPLEAATQPQNLTNCTVCGKPLTFKEGLSKTTGKPWKGYFCQEKNHPVSWIK